MKNISAVGTQADLELQNVQQYIRGVFGYKGIASAWLAKHSLLLGCLRPARCLQAAEGNNTSGLPRCTKWRPVMQCIVQHDIQDYLIISRVIQ